jgi:hypothetical protein
MLLSQNPATMACVARNLYRYVTGHIEAPGEEPAITQLAQAFSSGQFQWSKLVNGMMASAAFTTAAPPSNAPLNVSPTPDAGAAGGGGGSSGAGGSSGSGTDAGAVVSVPTGPISYATSVAPIIANKCSPCHTTQAAAGLNFTYANLVTNSLVTNATTKGCIFLVAPPRRVVPGDPDHSLLYVKLLDDEEQLTGTHMCGDAMPQAISGKSLMTAELDIINHWILGGALP